MGEVHGCVTVEMHFCTKLGVCGSACIDLHMLSILLPHIPSEGICSPPLNTHCNLEVLYAKMNLTDSLGMLSTVPKNSECCS